MPTKPFPALRSLSRAAGAAALMIAALPLAAQEPTPVDSAAIKQVADTRDISRTHAVVDHRERDGVDGLLTMSGGKLTTLRDGKVLRIDEYE